jgi:predicted transcriptional regulator of viral defense system
VQELSAENWIANNIEKIFPDKTLVNRNEVIAERFEVDLHLKDEKGNDLFIEIKAEGLKPRDPGRLLNYYSILSNLDKIQQMQFIVITPEISEETRDILNSFGIQVKLFSDLSIDERLSDFKLRELKNVLTPVESEVLSYINKKKCNLVDIEDISKRFNYDKKYASKILERLEKKEYLDRIKRGKYLYIPLEYGYENRYPPMNSLIVGSVLTEPYYFGYQTANRFYGYTTQFSPITYICTTKLVRPFRWKSITYRLVNLVEDKFFGFNEKKSDSCIIYVAEPEKAVLDTVDKPDYCGGLPQTASVIANAFRKGLDLAKLVKYAERFHSLTVIQRLGYITDFLQERKIIDEQNELLQTLQDLVPEDTSNSYLGSVKKYGRNGVVIEKWRMIENFSVENLLDEIEVG